MEVDRMAPRWVSVVLTALSVSGCYGGVTSGPTFGGRPNDSGGDAADGPSDESGGTSADSPSEDSNDPDGGASEGADSGDDDDDDTTVIVEPPPGIAIQFRGEPTYSRFVRLTHEQWERSVRDLLRLPEVPGLSGQFLPDPPEGKFSNNEGRLQVTEQLAGDYTRVAEELAIGVTSDPAALARLTGGVTDRSAFVRDFGLRAFRRPLEPAEQLRYETIFDSAGTLTDNPDAFAGGVRLVVEGILQSPHFVYRTELGAVGERLSGYELATKLSLFLRNTIPDDETLAAARDGRLDTQEGLRAEAERLMAMPEAVESVREFHAQLFRTFRYRDVEKDRDAFPSYDPSLNDELLAADLRFFDYIFENGLGLEALLLSPVAFVSSATASYYGVEAQGNELTQVSLGNRPGYLTRMGFLAVNGTLRDPDPIHRGVEVLKEVLCVEIPSPVGEIPPLPPQENGVTNRDRVSAHTGPGTCGATCHGTMINPVGFAFENYDALGLERQIDNGLPVDASGSFLYGELAFEFDNAIEMLNLMADSAQTQACYAKHIAEFVLARDLAQVDAAEVYALVENGGNEASMKDLMMSVILSPSFITREGDS